MMTWVDLTFQQFKQFTLAALLRFNLRDLGWRLGHQWWRVAGGGGIHSNARER